MNDVVETTEAPVEATNVIEPCDCEAPESEFTGLAASITDVINVLEYARDLAVKLQSGCTSKAELRKVSVVLRENLLNVKNASTILYRDTLKVREELASNVVGLSVEAKKQKIADKIAELQDKMNALQ